MPRTRISLSSNSAPSLSLSLASLASLHIAVFSVLLDLRGRDLLLKLDVTLDLLSKIAARRSACLISALLCTFKSSTVSSGYLALCYLCWVVLFWLALVAIFPTFSGGWLRFDCKFHNEYRVFGCSGVAAVSGRFICLSIFLHVSR